MQSLEAMRLSDSIASLLKAYRGPGGTFWNPGQVDNPQCDCDALGTTQHNCLDCYRWSSAIVLWSLGCGLLASPSLKLMFTSDFASIAEAFLQHSPYSPHIEDVVGPTFFVDDVFWYSIASATVYEVTGDERFRSLAFDLHALLLRDGRQCTKDGLCDYVWNTQKACGDAGCRGFITNERKQEDNVWATLPTVLLATMAPTPEQRDSLVQQAIFYVSSIWDTWQAKPQLAQESYKTGCIVAASAMLARLTGNILWADRARAMWNMGAPTFTTATHLVKATAGGDGQAFRAATYAALFTMVTHTGPDMLSSICGVNFALAQAHAVRSHLVATPACGPKGITPGIKVAPLSWGDEQPGEEAKCASSATTAAAVVAEALLLAEQRTAPAGSVALA